LTEGPDYLPNRLRVGGIYLSGDDPETGKNEGWDPMFARWPKWSESYIYTQIREDRVGYWTNLKSLWLQAEFKPFPESYLRLDYHHLMAPQASDFAQLFPGGGGDKRGDLFIGRLGYRFNKHLAGYILWEGFVPGDYYWPGANGYSWMRTELSWSW